MGPLRHPRARVPAAPLRRRARRVAPTPPPFKAFGNEYPEYVDKVTFKFAVKPKGDEKLALEMSDFARELSLSRIRAEHPEWSDWEVKRELLRLDFLPDALPPGLP